MKQIYLYLITVLIRGSTWIAIKFQLGDVDPMVSVIYRFGLASAVLFGICKVRGLTLTFSLQAHCFMALLGGCLFSINCWLIYQAEVYLTSGITAVVFSSLVFFNIANNRLFRGVAVNRKTLIGAMVGISGICLIYMREISSFSLADQGIKGFILALSSVMLASLGNIVSAQGYRHWKMLKKHCRLLLEMNDYHLKDNGHKPGRCGQVLPAKRQPLEMCFQK